MPYATSAISAHGAAVLAKTLELAAPSTAARGTRMLQRIFGRGDPDSRELIGKVAANLGDDQHHTDLQTAIGYALEADAVLAGEIRAMLT